jgi:uncharacterized RDD family membrane protein YckC
MAKQVPEGWYPDPAGSPYRRWWDGSQWTRHTDEPPVRPGAARAEAQAPRDEASDSPDAPNPAAAADAGNVPPVPPAAPVPPPYGAAPGYGTPQAGAPGYGAPGYGAPGYGSPAYGQAGFRPQRFVAPYAGFWQRVGAYIIDSLILGIPLGLVFLLLFWGDLIDFLEEVAANAEAGVSSPVAFDDLFVGFGLFFLIALVVSATYFTFTIALRGATLGMSVLRIQVVDEQGQMPSVGRSFWRWGFVQLFQFGTNFVPFVGGLLWLLDPLWMLWDPEKQTLHDKVAKTWVLQKLPEQTPLQGQPPAQW